MIKKIFGLLLLIVVLECALSAPSSAQTPPSCLATQYRWWTDGPIPIGWFYYLAYPGTYAYLIASMLCPPSPDCHCSAGTTSKPISLATGETFIEENDISIPGLGGGLSLARTWNSTWSSRLAAFQTGMFGPNWRSTYEERIVMSTDNYLTYLRHDGTFLTLLTRGPLTSFGATGPARDVVTLNTDTSINSFSTMTFSNGEQRHFDKTTGNLTAIIDRNGNTTTVAYDSSGRISTVTDPASRTLTFTYGNTTFTNLATSVNSSVGISYSYSYDSQGRLIQVTKPDSTTVSFTYDSQSRITTVTDSNGKVLESHTYDSNNRGLTGSRANGVEAVTITYPQ